MSAQESDVGLLMRAIAFAAGKHRSQKRKDHETPYINHPLEVANVLAGVGRITDPSVLAAAVLHDTIEDTDTTVEELGTAFGDHILSLVLECTDDKRLPKAERKRLQVEHAPTLTPQAKTIKIADKISNMRDLMRIPPVDWSEQRISEYISWCDRVFQGLKGVNAHLDKLFEEVRDLGRRHFPVD